MLASFLTWVLFRITERLPRRQRIIALLGRSEAIVDLADPVDVERDHIRGPQESLVTLLEYGDLECPYCGQAEPIVRELLSEFGDIRYVWRHLPLTDVHPHAQLAAEATEAAAAQGAFWEMHDLLFQHQDALGLKDLIGYARELGLDVDRFTDDVKHHLGAARVASDVDSADLSNVSGTPDLLHQRHPPPRRLRHRLTQGGGQGAGARQDQCVRKCGPGGGRSNVTWGADPFFPCGGAFWRPLLKSRSPRTNSNGAGKTQGTNPFGMIDTLICGFQASGWAAARRVCGGGQTGGSM